MAKIVTALAIYGLLLTAIVIGMLKVRAAFVNAPDLNQERQDWQVWRDRVEQQSHEPGPVQRKLPKSAEPPGLVLLRDHFGKCLATIIMISSALYGILVFLLHGVWNSPSLIDDAD